MTMKRALQLILAVSLVGVAFSGTLAYKERVLRDCGLCSAFNTSGTIFGLPVCVYGLVMYLLVAAIAGWGLRSRR